MRRDYINAHIGLRVVKYDNRLQHTAVTVIIPFRPAPIPRKMRQSATWGRRKMGSWPIFPLSLSSSVWNLKPGPFQPSLSPGLPVPPAPTLLCITQVHSAFSDLNQFWHFDRKLLSFFLKNHPFHHFIHFCPWHGVGFVPAKVVFKTFSSLLTECGLWNIWNFYFSIIPIERKHLSSCLFDRDAGGHDLKAPRKRVEASPASSLLSLLHLCIFNYITGM